jgi:8-amino-7-oxononanoate synthase
VPAVQPTNAFWDGFRARARKHDRLLLQRTGVHIGLWPYYRQVESSAGPVVQMDGAPRLMFGSNNYLGLTDDPRVKEAARAALDKYGTGMTGSRLLNGTIPEHAELEGELAEWMGTEAALVFTTGYQTNIGCLSSLLSPSDTVLCATANHASIFDGAELGRADFKTFRHGNWEQLERLLRRARDAGSAPFVVVDGVFSMEGQICDVPSVLALCREYGAALLVDEAHAVGVLGPRGTGACELWGVDGDVDLRTGTFSKSLASCGGYVAGPAEAIEYLRVDSRALLFSASGVPAAVAAALAALRVCRSEEGPQLFERLLSNTRYLRAGLAELGFRLGEGTALEDGTESVSAVIAVLVGDTIKAVSLWKKLYEAGMYVNVATFPAVPRGGDLLRVSVMATHEREHLDRAIDCFRDVRDQAEAGFFAVA